MNVIEPYWWQVSTGSFNDLVSSNNKPLPEQRFAQICDAIMSQWYTYGDHYIRERGWFLLFSDKYDHEKKTHLPKIWHWMTEKKIYYIDTKVQTLLTHPLQWRHNELAGVSNHQPRDWLLNRLLSRRSKKASKLRIIGLCVGKSPGSVNSPHKGPVTRKMFPFDDVIMSKADYRHLMFWRASFEHFSTDQFGND